MDRLVCGEVGYGKTEVALRAAVKAALDGKQVAMMAPTTILALQHYRNFQKRLSAFQKSVVTKLAVAITASNRSRSPHRLHRRFDFERFFEVPICF